MESPPCKNLGRASRLFYTIVEWLILPKWRDELVGNLKESSLSPLRRLLRAGDLICFAIVWKVRDVLLTSPLFDLNRLAMMITMAGMLAGLLESPAAPPSESTRGDYPYAVLTALVLIYCSRNLGARSLRVAGLFLILLVWQICLAYLSAFPGDTTVHIDKWTSLNTFLALSIVLIQRRIERRTSSQAGNDLQ